MQSSASADSISFPFYYILLADRPNVMIFGILGLNSYGVYQSQSFGNILVGDL